MLAGQLQAQLDLTTVAGYREAGLEASPLPYHRVGGDRAGDIRRLHHAEGPLAQTGSQFPPQRREAIIGVEHEGPVGTETVDDLGLGPRNALEAAETLQMCPAGVVQHRHVGLHQAGQVVDLACVTGAHLDHGEALVAQAAQGQGDADIVVQVAARRQHRPAAHQDRRDHLLERGLAVAAGNRDHPRSTAQTPLPSQVSQSTQRVVDLDRGQPGGGRARDQGSGGAAFLRDVQIVVAVKVGAAQRHEQLVALQGAGVSTHTVESAVVAAQLAVDHLRQLGQVQHAHADPSRSAIRTWSISLNGRRLPAISW